jgi:hypothetical protein
VLQQNLSGDSKENRGDPVEGCAVTKQPSLDCFLVVCIRATCYRSAVPVRKLSLIVSAVFIFSEWFLSYNGRFFHTLYDCKYK